MAEAIRKRSREALDAAGLDEGDPEYRDPTITVLQIVEQYELSFVLSHHPMVGGVWSARVVSDGKEIAAATDARAVDLGTEILTQLAAL